MSHLNEKVVQLMITNNKHLDLIYRVASKFDCFVEAAKILVKMQQPKLAVRVAMKVNLEYTNALMSTITDTKMQKEAWVELLFGIY